MKNSNVLIALVVIVLLLAGVVYYINYEQPEAGSPALSPAPAAVSGAPESPNFAPDNTATINAELEGLDVGDLDEEFADIDRDLNSL